MDVIIKIFYIYIMFSNIIEFDKETSTIGPRLWIRKKYPQGGIVGFDKTTNKVVYKIKGNKKWINAPSQSTAKKLLLDIFGEKETFEGTFDSWTDGKARDLILEEMKNKKVKKKTNKKANNKKKSTRKKWVFF